MNTTAFALWTVAMLIVGVIVGVFAAALGRAARDEKGATS